MIDSILAAPVMLKVLGSLVVILAANAVVKHLMVSILMGCFVLAGWCGFPPARALDIAWSCFIAPDNLALLAVLVLVIWLTALMDRAGFMGDLVEALRFELHFPSSC